MDASILIVDDEPEIADLVEVYLKNEGFPVLKAYTAAEALEIIAQKELSLAILDVMLPDMDGFTLCQKIRESHLYPILMLSAKVEDMDKIMGLTLGADDYITKPFGMMEFISRVKAVLRRGGSRTEETLVHGPIQIRIQRHEVLVHGQKVELTLKEFELLKYLVENRGIVLTRDQLLTRIWGYDFDGETRTVDVHVRTLRQKLGEAGACIETVRGVGYRMGDEA